MEKKAHLALYRKWRPQTFDEVCGQDHITSVLKYEVENNHISHAYLFSGSRGTGKTSCAKILAKAVNCERPQGGSPCGLCVACRAIDSGRATEVLELDAASNNRVENIRDIRDEVIYAPSALRYRVYIIDEVHMLSSSAFNALLKTLEEPPEHVIFILATTEQHKLPATVISRCQRFEFRRIVTDDIIARLSYIAKEEGIELDRDAARLLVRLAQGGMRDAISLLELCAGGGKRITPEDVYEAVGSTGRAYIIETARAVAQADYDKIFDIIAGIANSSKDIAVFWQDLLSLWRDMLVMKTIPNTAARYLDLTDFETAQLTELSGLFSRETLLAHCRQLEGALQTMQRSNMIKRTIAELTLLSMSDGRLDIRVESLIARIARLEEALGSGAFQLAPRVADNSDAKVKAEATYNNDGQDDREKHKNQVTKPARSAKIQANIAKSDTKLMPEAQEQPKKPESREQTITQNPGSQKPFPREQSEKPKPTLKTITRWDGVVARISSKMPQLAGLLTGSRAFTGADGKVIIRFEKSFSIMIIEQWGAKNLIRSELGTELDRELREGDLIFEVAPPEEPDEDDAIFDEINKYSKEMKETRK
ncbi:MAG: DNA polymerase III subunit gamma/tau [Eubacteriales bacterium]|jgi:DNA polymerase-3 subunit gamma/tau